MMTFTYNSKAKRKLWKTQAFSRFILFLFLGFAYLSMFLNAAYHVLSTLGPLPHTNDEAA